MLWTAWQLPYEPDVNPRCMNDVRTMKPLRSCARFAWVWGHYYLRPCLNFGELLIETVQSSGSEKWVRAVSFSSHVVKT
jgi:hypothetical protein